MRRARLVSVVVLAAVQAEAMLPALPPASLAPDADRVVAATVVPDAVRKVGEVRLVARGDATVVQTLLATKALARVVSEIRKKEEGNWPAPSPGRADMERYLSAVFRAADALAARREHAGAGDDRRLRLVVEFIATPDATGVFVGEFTGDEVDGRLRPSGRRAIETFPLARPYVVRNMRLILADSFHLSEHELGTLGPLGPIAVDADAR